MDRQTIKQILLVAAVVVAAFIVVTGGGLSDDAKTPFWWHFWSIAAWVLGIALIGGWVYLKAKDRSEN